MRFFFATVHTTVSTAVEFVSAALREVIVGFLLSWYRPSPHPIHVSDIPLTRSKLKSKLYIWVLSFSSYTSVSLLLSHFSLCPPHGHNAVDPHLLFFNGHSKSLTLISFSVAFLFAACSPFSRAGKSTLSIRVIKGSPLKQRLQYLNDARGNLYGVSRHPKGLWTGAFSPASRQVALSSIVPTVSVAPS